ncbi:hypothetical protein [Sphingobacterium faecale]|uniref:Uncharacterized protein n=1 Tax=Sphingobacterium faecale TaxID=2803775 RepID=A0ABS1QZY0_9SPHI|nr:hypothetical protein [Sphingobacterium faecale]MBL1407635.1 hypothetical protein [Sphingobacterium faecale]
MTTKKVIAIKGTGSQLDRSIILPPIRVAFEAHCVISAEAKGITSGPVPAAGG